MRIEEVTAGKKDHEEVKIHWASLPVAALKKLMKDGYDDLTFYEENRTFSLWGKKLQCVPHRTTDPRTYLTLPGGLLRSVAQPSKG